MGGVAVLPPRLRRERHHERAATVTVDVNRLRVVAESADRDGRPWAWTGVGGHGYPQRIIRVGDAVLMAECYDDPDTPDPTAEFISTFDPPTVLALLDAVGRTAQQETT